MGSPARKYLLDVLKFIKEFTDDKKECHTKDIKMLLWKFSYIAEEHTHLENLDLLVSCCLKFVDLLIQCGESIQTFHTEYKGLMYTYFAFLNDIGKNPNLRNYFCEAIAVPLLERITDPCVKSFYGEELTRNLNYIIQNADKNVRNKMISSNAKLYMYKLADLISTCGDFEYQTSLVETIFRMCTVDYVRKYAKQFFPALKDLQDALMKFDVNDFDRSLRIFLNIVNLNYKAVFSITVSSAYLGDVLIIPPANVKDSKEDLWIDFNTVSGTIGIFCDKESFVSSSSMTNSQDDAAWELLTFFSSDISHVELVREKAVNREDRAAYSVIFQKSAPCHYFSKVSQPVASSSSLTMIIFDEVVVKKLKIVLSNMFGEKFEVFLDESQHSKSTMISGSPTSQLNDEVLKSFYYNYTSKKPTPNDVYVPLGQSKCFEKFESDSALRPVSNDARSEKSFRDTVLCRKLKNKQNLPAQMKKAKKIHKKVTSYAKENSTEVNTEKVYGISNHKEKNSGLYFFNNHKHFEDKENLKKTEKCNKKITKEKNELIVDTEKRIPAVKETLPFDFRSGCNAVIIQKVNISDDMKSQGTNNRVMEPEENASQSKITNLNNEVIVELNDVNFVWMNENNSNKSSKCIKAAYQEELDTLQSDNVDNIEDEIRLQVAAEVVQTVNNFSDDMKICVNNSGMEEPDILQGDNMNNIEGEICQEAAVDLQRFPSDHVDNIEGELVLSQEQNQADAESANEIESDGETVIKSSQDKDFNLKYKYKPKVVALVKNPSPKMIQSKELATQAIDTNINLNLVCNRREYILNENVTVTKGKAANLIEIELPESECDGDLDKGKTSDKEEYIGDVEIDKSEIGSDNEMRLLLHENETNSRINFKSQEKVSKSESIAVTKESQSMKESDNHFERTSNTMCINQDKVTTDEQTYNNEINNEIKLTAGKCGTDLRNYNTLDKEASLDCTKLVEIVKTTVGNDKINEILSTENETNLCVNVKSNEKLFKSVPKKRKYVKDSQPAKASYSRSKRICKETIKTNQSAASETDLVDIENKSASTKHERTKYSRSAKATDGRTKKIKLPVVSNVLHEEMTQKNDEISVLSTKVGDKNKSASIEPGDSQPAKAARSRAKKTNETVSKIQNEQRPQTDLQLVNEVDEIAATNQYPSSKVDLVDKEKESTSNESKRTNDSQPTKAARDHEEHLKLNVLESNFSDAVCDDPGNVMIRLPIVLLERTNVTKHMCDVLSQSMKEHDICVKSQDSGSIFNVTTQILSDNSNVLQSKLSEDVILNFEKENEALNFQLGRILDDDMQKTNDMVVQNALSNPDCNELNKPNSSQSFAEFKNSEQNLKSLFSNENQNKEMPENNHISKDVDSDIITRDECMTSFAVTKNKLDNAPPKALNKSRKLYNPLDLSYLESAARTANSMDSDSDMLKTFEVTALVHEPINDNSKYIKRKCMPKTKGGIREDLDGICVCDDRTPVKNFTENYNTITIPKSQHIKEIKENLKSKKIKGTRLTESKAKELKSIDKTISSKKRKQNETLDYNADLSKFSVLKNCSYRDTITVDTIPKKCYVKEKKMQNPRPKKIKQTSLNKSKNKERKSTNKTISPRKRKQSIPVDYDTDASDCPFGKEDAELFISYMSCFENKTHTKTNNRSKRSRLSSKRRTNCKSLQEMVMRGTTYRGYDSMEKDIILPNLCKKRNLEDDKITSVNVLEAERVKVAPDTTLQDILRQKILHVDSEPSLRHEPDEVESTEQITQLKSVTPSPLNDCTETNIVQTSEKNSKSGRIKILQNILVLPSTNHIGAGDVFNTRSQDCLHEEESLQDNNTVNTDENFSTYLKPDQEIKSWIATGSTENEHCTKAYLKYILRKEQCTVNYILEVNKGPIAAEILAEYKAFQQIANVLEDYYNQTDSCEFPPSF